MGLLRPAVPCHAFRSKLNIIRLPEKHAETRLGLLCVGSYHPLLFLTRAYLRDAETGARAASIIQLPPGVG